MDELKDAPIEILQIQIEDMLSLAKIHLKRGHISDIPEDCVIPHLKKISLLKHDIMERINHGFNDPSVNKV